LKSSTSLMNECFDARGIELLARPVRLLVQGADLRRCPGLDVPGSEGMAGIAVRPLDQQRCLDPLAGIIGQLVMNGPLGVAARPDRHELVVGDGVFPQR
jgi:hypothetical protein